MASLCHIQIAGITNLALWDHYENKGDLNTSLWYQVSGYDNQDCGYDNQDWPKGNRPWSPSPSILRLLFPKKIEVI